MSKIVNKVAALLFLLVITPTNAHDKNASSYEWLDISKKITWRNYPQYLYTYLTSAHFRKAIMQSDWRVKYFIDPCYEITLQELHESIKKDNDSGSYNTQKAYFIFKRGDLENTHTFLKNKFAHDTISLKLLEKECAYELRLINQKIQQIELFEKSMHQKE